ncbi:MAG: ECF transporter S component [Clostridia bacterium]|nr:ECF transporter S component [Clostridia bacterium]
MKTNKQAVRQLVGTAILAAVIVILQLVASGIKIGPFTITLSLIPIILGAILFGPVSGAVLGAIFGGMVCVAVVTGADPGGHLMFQQNPVLTLFLCVLKSTVAGLVAGLVWKLFQKMKKPTVGVVVSSILCPVCNTGILCIGILAFYHDLVTGWALGNGFANAFAYVILGMVGLNFLVELAINIVLTPVILRIISIVKKRIS